MEDINKTYEKITKIKHIVISGGAIYGFSFFAILKILHQKGIWNLSDIYSIYATSIGSIIATIITLGYEWDVIEKYLIQRPLEHLLKFDISTIFGCIENCGFFSIKVIEELFYNLFTGKDISPTVTMDELFEITNIELHFYAVKVDGFELIDISHKTHPNWKVVEAIYASCAIPPFLQPLIKDNIIYCDGGFLNNNPLGKCINDCKNIEPNFNTDSILNIRITGINNIRNERNEKNDESINGGYTMINYFENFIGNLLTHLSIEKNNENIKMDLKVNKNFMPLLDFTLFTKIEKKIELMDYGVKIAEEFLDTKMNQTENLP